MGHPMGTGESHIFSLSGSLMKLQVGALFASGLEANFILLNLAINLVAGALEVLVRTSVYAYASNFHFCMTSEAETRQTRSYSKGTRDSFNESLIYYRVAYTEPHQHIIQSLASQCCSIDRIVFLSDVSWLRRVFVQRSN